MTAIPARVRAWGWFMNRFDSMHIATMSPSDIAHNQTMRHVPAPVRRALFGRRDPRVTVDDRTIPAAPGSTTSIPIRIYRPRTASIPPAPATAAPAPASTSPAPATAPPAPTTATRDAPLPIALYFHGGGWTLFGGLDMCDWLPSRVAAELGAIVVAVDYRLAPEHPFPAAVDDSVAALAWVSANASSLGADAARLAVFGDSAGGNLSAVLALLARDAGGPRIAAQGLIYPVTETVLDDGSMRANARSPVLHRADMAAFLDYYLGADLDSAARVDARAAPALATTLARLPPALVQLGAHDVLHDQGARYSRRLEADGTAVTLITYPEAPHGWVTYPTIMRVAARATDDLVRFLREHLG